MGDDDVWAWPCPYCRTPIAIDAPRCTACGSQLRHVGTDDLFSTVAPSASDHDVVVADVTVPRIALPDTDQQLAGLVVDPPPADPVTVPSMPESATASNGATPVGGGAIPGPEQGRPAAVTSPPTASAQQQPRSVDPELSVPVPPVVPSVAAPWSDPAPPVPPAASAPAPPVPPSPPVVEPPPAPPSPPVVEPPPVAAPGAGLQLAPPPYVAPSTIAVWTPAGLPALHHPMAPIDDFHRLADAVDRLRPGAAEEAAIPISVVGALLQSDEVVLALVTGQMLGHPAVVVLTDERVLVVNGRRWQPIVDEYPLTSELVVRGRHDRDVASLTFTRGTQFSTVDWITDVALAVELAERIRGD